MSDFASDVERWRPLVDDYGCEMGTDYALAFVEHESGGHPFDTTGMHFSDGTLREVGIGQIDFGDHPDGIVYGVTRAQLLDGSAGGLRGGGRPSFEQLSDTAKQANTSSTCDQIDHFTDLAQTQLANAGADWNGLDLGRLVKMQHNLPAIPSALLPGYVSANGRPPEGWDEWRAWVEGLSGSELGQYNARLPAFAPLGHLFVNAETVASRAGLGSDSPLSLAAEWGEWVIPVAAVFYALVGGVA